MVNSHSCSHPKRNHWTRMSYHVLYLKLFRNQGGASRRLMAATSPSFSPQRSTLLEFPRSSRSLPSFSVRFSAKSNGASVSPTCDSLAQGPHCIYVGPIESASQETLEALYLQARDAYYSGRPLIVDDMFDRVELKLRWYGSKSVVKYPRCSIRRQSTYADAEADLSMIFALASTWIVFLAFGSTICVGPVLYTISMAYYTAFHSGLSYVNQGSGLGFLATVNSVVLMTLGCVIGYPVASASAKVLQGLWRNDLVALKGACPNCGEEVFAFVRMDRANDSPHRADCHVCGCLLEFQTQVEVIAFESSAIGIQTGKKMGLRAYLPRFAQRQIPAPKTVVNS